MDIQIDNDLKDIVISALRYALGRKTYITHLTANYIMGHPELIDERVRKVMLNDLRRYFDQREEHLIYDDKCDYRAWTILRDWLEEEE